MIEFSSAMPGGDNRNYEVPGQLPGLRPTDNEVLMIRAFPNDSPLLREWIGAEDGSITLDASSKDVDRRDNDPALYQGAVVDVEGAEVKRFTYRAEHAGPVSRTTARAIGWLVGESVAPRGWLSGRIHPSETREK